MKSETATRFDYVAVEHLEVGQTIVNLGIIKTIKPYPSAQRFEIVFSPERCIFKRSYWYQKGDKLMIA